MEGQIKPIQNLCISITYTYHFGQSKTLDLPTQKYTRQRSFLQYLNSDFLFYLGWSGSVSTKQAKYNEGCSKLNYLLAEV